MFKKLTLLLLLLALLIPGAQAEEIYRPGGTTAALFGEAFRAGKLIQLDYRAAVTADPAALGLTQEEADAAAMLLPMLEHATFSFAAGQIEGGLRLELGAAYEDTAPVAVSAALNITRDGLLAESSLLPGEAVRVSYETLLALAGLDEATAAAVLSLRDADLTALRAQIEEAVAAALPLAAQALAPYAQTLTDFVAALPCEIEENLPEEDGFPATAKAYTYAVTALDLNMLLTALADQLESDAMTVLLVNGALATAKADLTVADLCAAIRQAATLLTDTDMPLYLTVGLDEAGALLHVTASRQMNESLVGSVCYMRFPEAEDGVDVYILDAYAFDAEGSIVMSLGSALGLALDPADRNAYEISGELYATRGEETPFTASFMAASAPQPAEDGLPGYAQETAFILTLPQGGADLNAYAFSEGQTLRSSDGGEVMSGYCEAGLSLVQGEEEQVILSIPAEMALACAPAEGGPTLDYALYTEIPGMLTYEEHTVMFARDYDPAATAALRATVLDAQTAGEALAPLLGRLAHNAQALADALAAQLPAATPAEAAPAEAL